MSFSRLLDREVTIVPRIVTGEDARGNDVIGDGTPVEGVKAGRDPLEATEDLDERDQQGRVYVYFLPAGTPITGYDRIVDGDETFEVRGAPDRVVRRRGGREHHVEAIAYLIDG